MTTTSTLAAVKTQLVSLLSTALANSGDGGGQVPVFYAWTPDATDECVFLGRALLDPTDRDEIEITYTPLVAELNAPMTETYEVPVSMWSFRPDLNPDQAQAAEARLQELNTVVLGVVATGDFGSDVRVRARPGRATSRTIAWERGRACFLVAEVAVSATVT
jgi:hypothetical protein